MNTCKHGKIILPNAKFALVCERGAECIDYVNAEQLEERGFKQGN